MADTLSLDAAVSYILERGGSVRLIGDDQQLAAIGAGGVLRDIRATHGALQLTELVRFKDPAEGAASLALREGKPESLGFYLDRDRVHVGDLATMTEDVFAAWQADRAAGLDAIMLAPTRELVSELNQQARAHRLDGIDPADGASWPGRARRRQRGLDRRADHHPRERPPPAHLGHRLGEERRPLDRAGDPRRRRPDRPAHPARPHRAAARRLRRPVHRARLRVHRAHRPGRHRRHHARPGHRHRVAPAALHDDDPRRARQPRLPRGRRRRRPALGDPPDPGPAAHAHRHPRVDAGPRRPRSGPRPACCASRPTRPPGSARPPSATSTASTSPPRTSAPRRRRPRRPTPWTTRSTTLLPGLSDEARLADPARPPAAARRRRPEPRRRAAHAPPPRAANWRRRPTAPRSSTGAWTPPGCATPTPRAAALDARGPAARLAEDPALGCLPGRQRAHLVAELADRSATGRHHRPTPPGRRTSTTGPQDRADGRRRRGLAGGAMQVPVDDRRPTGAPQLQKASATWQRQLNRAVTGDHTPALKEWRQLLYSLAPQVRDDEFTPLLAERLAAMSRAGVNAHQLLRTAAGDPGDLPDEHAAAALWWRMARHLTPAVPPPRSALPGQRVTTDWTTTARRHCSAPSAADASRPAPGGPRSSRTWTTACSAAGSSRPCWAPARCRATADRASTSARPWSGGPRSRWRPPPTSTRTRSTSTSRPPTCGTAFEPDPPRSSIHTDDIDWPPTHDRADGRPPGRPSSTTWPGTPTRTTVAGPDLHFRR